MRWDPTGERLVVSFVDSNLLAVFQTQISNANLNISPLGFINGASESEFPSCFEFAQHLNSSSSSSAVEPAAPATGSLLTIAWSSGRVQHFPMFFSPTVSHVFDNCHITTAAAAAPSALSPFSLQQQQQQFQHPETTRAVPGISRQLSTSHLANNSQAEFEPQLFSSPAF